MIKYIQESHSSLNASNSDLGEHSLHTVEVET